MPTLRVNFRKRVWYRYVKPYASKRPRKRKGLTTVKGKKKDIYSIEWIPIVDGVRDNDYVIVRYVEYEYKNASPVYVTYRTYMGKIIHLFGKNQSTFYNLLDAKKMVLNYMSSVLTSKEKYDKIL
jgi:hypothetical protein